MNNKLKKLFRLHILPISVMLVMFLISCEARGEEECSKWWDLSSEQRYRLQWAYSYGEQYDLGWTMSAIAWHESNAGQNKINTKSNDYGVFQVNLITATDIMVISGYWNKQALITKMVVDDEFNAYLALHVLQHFQKTRKSWKSVVRSYNEGNKWLKDEKSSNKSLDYYKKIRNNVITLKQCSDFN